MAMDHATYCAKICGAKCCYMYLPHPMPCPCLASDATCSIYEDRFREGSPDLLPVGHFQFEGRLRPFICGKILDVIRKGWLLEEVEAQCCYAHPELLEATPQPDARKNL